MRKGCGQRQKNCWSRDPRSSARQLFKASRPAAKKGAACCFAFLSVYVYKKQLFVDSVPAWCYYRAHKSLRKSSKSLPSPEREPQAVELRQVTSDRMDFREQTEMPQRAALTAADVRQSMGDGVWLSVIKGQRMMVRSEWARCNDASSRVAPQIFLSRQTDVLPGFFISRQKKGSICMIRLRPGKRWRTAPQK